MAAITGLNETAFRTRNEAQSRTPAEVLAHVLATERALIAGARAGAAPPDHTNADHNDSVSGEDAKMAQRMPVPQIIHGLLAQRRDTLQLVDEAGEDKTFPMLRDLAEHEGAHAEQIRALRRVADSSPAISTVGEAGAK